PANNNDPQVKGTAEPSSTVKLYSASDCSGSVAGSGSADSSGDFSIAVHVSDDSSTTYYATATDAAQKPSDCSTDSVTYVEDSTNPDVTIDQAALQSDPTNAQPIHFTASFSEHVNGFSGSDVTLSGTAGHGAASVTITPLAGNSYDLAVSGLTSVGTISAAISAAKVTDDAGNS